ncbi:MFS transporter [Tunturibacter empetritectus]|uniref:MFS family permease n=1 Tax=Tunturiibacter lichenicola TaxID=2051959 RepID=A0A7W8JC10_9BACT|nr:MFS transporter [Edaphobacter lichenicola]MBB5345089.1 MFS family permease [Edaphobacter lichenicola]
MVQNAKSDPSDRAPSRQSRFGLNAANFFQAEAVGVVLPILNTFLKEARWRYDQIGLATALLGLGTLLFQTPAGVLVDRFKNRRLLFFVASIVVGVCFGVIPFVPRSALWIDSLLFLSGVAQSIFIPVLGALALALVGYKALNRTLGENQGWNHVGNIVAALLAFVAVRYFGSASIFYSVAIASLVGAFSVYWMRKEELNEEVASGDGKQPKVKWGTILHDRPVLFLLAAVALFHLANAPILPVTALYIKQLGGSSALTTFTVLSAQLVMVPVAWATGRLCDSWGRKPIMAIAFWVLPFRIFSYILAHSPHMVVSLQALDGIGAGIYSVAIVAFAADLTRGKGQFNSLLGIFATAQAIGGVVGPIVSGLVLQHFGFNMTFLGFAVLALLAAAIFQLLVPNTQSMEAPQAASTVNA